MTPKGEQSTRIASHKILSVASFTESQEKIIRRIGRPLDLRERVNNFCKRSNIIHEATGFMRAAIRGLRSVLRNSLSCSSHVRSVNSRSLQAR